MTTLPNIGKPAKNALESIGFTTLEQVRLLDKVTLSKIHGVGSKAINILEKSLSDHNWTFRTNDFSPKIDFAVICLLNCDNAPKRRIIRDYLVAVASGNQLLLDSLLTDSFRWIIPGKEPLTDKATFISKMCKNRKEISTLEIHSLVTHGKDGAAHGTITTKTGDKIFFSDNILFASHQKDARITQITSFILSE